MALASPLRGTSDPELAWPFFQALRKELLDTPSSDETKRPPVMLAIDGTHHVMRDSKYMSADFKPVRSRHLHIQQNQVGQQRFGHFDALGPVARHLEQVAKGGKYPQAQPPTSRIRGRAAPNSRTRSCFS